MASGISVIDIRGLNTGWLSAGDESKPILFFIHGYPDTPESWDFQIEYFKDKFQVIAPYARGARPSDRSPTLDRYSLDAVALDHLQILKHVDPSQSRQVFVVGHDIGGAQAWRLARHLGKRLSGMVIIGSLSIEQMARRIKSSFKQNKKSGYIYAFLTGYFRNYWIKKNPAKLLQKAHDRGNLSPKLRPPIAKAITGVVNPVQHYRAFLPDFLKSFVKKPPVVHAPVLVLWGNQDAFLEVVQKNEMDLVSSNHTIRILEGNHWLHREQAAAVNELMEEFLCTLIKA